MSFLKHICLLLLCLAANSGFAVLVRPLPIEELNQRSESVVHATVTAKSVQRDAQGRIYTKVTLQVQESWKGKRPPENFSLVHSGGVLGDKIATVSGQPEYEIGEEVVLFLVLNQRGEGVTLGLAQGKFKVQEEPHTREKHVGNPFHGEQPGKPGKRLPLAELKARVKGGAQ